MEHVVITIEAPATPRVQVLVPASLWPSQDAWEVLRNRYESALALRFMRRPRRAR